MPNASEVHTPPSPERLTDLAFAFQRTAALRAAAGLDLFTAICEGADTVSELATRCGADERGVRTLCDFLVALELLTKTGERYAAAADAAAFLNRGSPAFIGDALGFVASDTQVEAALKDPAAPVRRGGTGLGPSGHLVAPDHADWATYARAMAPLMARSAAFLADIVAGEGEVKDILDVAAGPGQNGIALARRLPDARVTALDWPNVLAVARRHAEAAGIADRWAALPGSALDVTLGGPYDLVLIVRFLHLLAPEEGEALLRRVHAALAPGGRILALQIMLNEDRASPPFAAMMNYSVLGTTPSGRVSTADELETLLRSAGFDELAWHPLPESDERAVVARKQT